VEGTSLRIVQALAVALVVFHLVHLALSGVFMDESYYWMWGQHPSLSYYDHPGLNAWLLGLSSAVFGWNVLALRLPVALAFLADILALYLFARRISGETWQAHFWPSLLLFCVTPIYWMVTIVAIPDHLLLTGCLFSIYFLFRFFEDRSKSESGASRDLYLGALFMGLGGLAKYNAAFLAVGLALFVLLYDRKLLREGRLYVATVLTVLLQLPTLLWNATENFATFEFIFRGRHTGLRASFDGMYPLALGILVFISPILFWPIAKFAFSRNVIPGMGFARSGFFVSTACIVAVAFTTATLFHWNLVAYAAMLPFLAVYMRPRWLLGLQAIYGMAFAIAVFINYSIVPITDVDGWKDEASAWSYGWSDVAAAAEQAKVDNKAGFIAATDYTTASLLGFATKDRDVVSLSPKTDAYDFWFDAKSHAGQDAILYGDRWRPLNGAVTRLFKEVTELGSYPVVVHGRTLDLKRIYLAKSFTPDG
jgi:4-amino-4-deoxy-L-arabinose transferase-like glycosyltransferase